MENPVDLIRRYQSLPWVHPLTCGSCDERKKVLEPEFKDGALNLHCPTCGADQEIRGGLLEAVLHLARLRDPLEALGTQPPDTEEGE